MAVRHIAVAVDTRPTSPAREVGSHGAHLPRVRLRRPDELREGPAAAAALALRALDPLAAVAALAAACAWTGRIFAGPALASAIVAALVVFMQFRSAALAQPWLGARWRDMYLHLGGCTLGSIGALAAIAGLSGTWGVLPARVIQLWILTAVILIFAQHSAVRALLVVQSRARERQRRALVVGSGEIGRALVRELDAMGTARLHCVGVVDDIPDERDRRRLAGGLDQVARYVNELSIDLVYITLPMADDPRLRALLDSLRDTTASVYFVPDLLFLELVHARVDHVNGIPVIGVCESPLDGINAVLKRGFDLVVAGSALVVLAPLLAALALAVRLESPGPVLFRQRRYGLGGESIMVYKFRSMRVLEDGGEITQARRDDARVTGVGRFMRRWSLDELPQFVNVLQGRMSVVGPRPHAVAHNEQYRGLIGGYMLRHKVKPGITGWAQVNGLRGETETLEKMRARVEYDLDYLRHWSLGLDLRIVLRTVGVVLRADAY